MANSKKSSSLKEVINELAQKFESIKPMLDAYPNALRLIWSDEKGYMLDVDLDCLEKSDLSINYIKLNFGN